MDDFNDETLRQLQQAHPGKHLIIDEEGRVVATADTKEELSKVLDGIRTEGVKFYLHVSPDGTHDHQRYHSRPRGRWV